MKRYVYFAERDDLIKIGLSVRPFERCDEFGARVITALVGSHALETGLHHLLIADRTGVEWFNPSADVWEIIDLVVHGYHDTVRRMVAEFLAPGIAAHECKRSMARDRRLQGRKTTAHLDLIREQRAAGVGYRSIARLLRDEHDTPVSHEWVRRALLDANEVASRAAGRKRGGVALLDANEVAS